MYLKTLDCNIHHLIINNSNFVIKAARPPRYLSLAHTLLFVAASWRRTFLNDSSLHRAFYCAQETARVCQCCFLGNWYGGPAGSTEAQRCWAEVGTHGLWGERREPFPEILCSRSPYMEAHSTSGATIHQTCFSQAGGRGWFPRVG